MRIAHSRNKALWYVLDEEDYIIKVYHTKKEALDYIQKTE